MNRWKGRFALVTGASGGIGAAICSKLGERGLTVVGCARNIDKMQELVVKFRSFDGDFYPIECDLTNEEEVMKMFEKIRNDCKKLHICINCAGCIKDSPLLTGATSDWRTMLEVNIISLSVCTREAVKLMREGAEECQIIHIGSIGGHKVPSEPTTVPGFYFYCGTKFMTRALTECLRQEVQPGNIGDRVIRVASISPGLVKTEFLRESLKDDFEKLIAAAPLLEASDVVDAVEYILTSSTRANVSDVIVLPVEKEKPDN